MASKKNTPPAVAPSTVTGSPSGWGPEVEHARVPSGIKLRFSGDDNMLLKFLGDRDITDMLKEDDRARNEATGKRAIIHTFYDGKNYVSLAAGAASLQANFRVNHWYYLHNRGEIEMGVGRADMRDLEIRRIGEDGTTVTCPDYIHPERKLTVNDAECARLNYGFLNYPLRTK